MTTTPATSVKITTWNNLHFSRQPALPTAAPSYFANLVIATTEYLGDADGNPRAMVTPIGSDVSGNLFVSPQVTDLFSEILTRADGSQATLLEVLTKTLDSAVPSLVEKASQMPVPPTPPVA